MNAEERRSKLDSLTEGVLGAMFEVSNTLGSGFLEKVYERALMRELQLRSIPAESQVTFSVVYKGHHVGDYCADIVVADALVVELKCAERLTNDHVAQCLNYLRVFGQTTTLLPLTAKMGFTEGKNAQRYWPATAMG